MLDKLRADQDKQQQEACRTDRRQATTTTRVHINHTLPDHCATAHATKKSGDGIGNALADTLFIASTSRLSQFVDQTHGQQRLNKADGGENDRVGKNNE